jgi:hypothetical protein
MPAKAVRILAVGPVVPHLSALLERLARNGWGSYSVESFAEARTVLRTLQFEVILAAEFLVDGSGFQIAREMGPRTTSLYVDVSLSEGHLWLPVVERGANTLGERALDAPSFEQELGELLSGSVASGRVFERAFERASERAPGRAAEARKRPWPNPWSKMKLKFELNLPTDAPSLPLEASLPFGARLPFEAEAQMAFAATAGATSPAKGKKRR